MDPESQKCVFAIMFSIDLEISKSCPIGMGIGMIVGFIVELLRQKEIENRPRGKNSLDYLLDSYNSPTIGRCLSYDDDEERISLIKMPVGPT